MSKLPIEIHPSKLSAFLIKSENMINVVMPISPQSIIKPSDTLSLCLTLEQAEELREMLHLKIKEHSQG